jgi:transposase
VGHARAAFGNSVRFRAFAVVNGTESPQAAQSRIDQMAAEGIEIDPVCFTPHNWHGSQPYVNKATGWTLMDIERCRWRN